MGEDGLPEIDMGRARAVQMDRIRTLRNHKLAVLDVAYMRAIESGDDAQIREIINQKATLRDIPETFNLEGASTPSELANNWPPELR